MSYPLLQPLRQEDFLHFEHDSFNLMVPLGVSQVHFLGPFLPYHVNTPNSFKISSLWRKIDAKDTHMNYNSVSISLCVYVNGEFKKGVARKVSCSI